MFVIHITICVSPRSPHTSPAADSGNFQSRAWDNLK